MATVTPNFNWPVPTSTDLVKDGATAIEALGDSIDASLVDLKGGTTGQVLSKNSNTDMDFTWVTDPGGDITGVTAGTGISGGGTSGTVTVTNSMATTITTKGDLVPGTGSGTFARLAAGNNGETLVADSSTSTGLRYQGTFAGGKNLIINGAMTYAQRGTSSTYLSAGQYRLDRWAPYEYQSCNAQQVTTGSTTVPSYYALRAGSTTSAQGASRIAIGQQIESLYAQNFAGQTVTLSYWVKYSAASTPSGGGNAYAQITTSTAVDPAMSTAGTTALVTNVITNGSLPTTWTKYSITGTLPTNTRTIQIKFQIDNPVSTTNANDFYFDITGVQLEVGSVATGFTMAGGTIQGELAACQRYYLQIATGNSVPISLVWYDSASLIRGLYQMPVVMRTTSPTLVQTTGTNYYSTQDGDGFNSLTLYNSSANTVAWYNNTEVSGTNSRPQGINTNNASASLGLSAEL